MKRLRYAIISLACCTLGMLYFAYNQGWIIICTSSYQIEAAQTAHNLRAKKKLVNLIFWHNNKWNAESVEILETADRAQTIHYLINNWLTLLDEDNIMKKKVTLQSALVSLNSQLYLSFDRYPFDENSSTYEKWMWIEGLLKTIRENETSFQSVHFLVHHHIMEDNHLDFSCAWPVAGFPSK